MAEIHETDIAIIGGGIAGMASAYHLAEAGRRVTLLEKGAAGAQASGVNFGGLRTNGRAMSELSLSLRARAIWRKLKDLIGHDCETEFTGHVEICDREDHLAAVEKWAPEANELGVGAEMLSATGIARRFPWIGRRMLGGCFVAADGAANPRLVTPVLARAVRRLGVVVREQEPVTSVAHANGRFEIETGKGARIRSAILVNAAGAWGARIARQLGEDYPLDVMAPQMVVSEPFQRQVTATVDYPVNGRFFYARQIGRGNLLFGRGPGRADLDTSRAAYVPQNVFDASRVAIDILPMLKGRTFLRTWAGVEGKTPDSLPILGPSPVHDGLIHAFGFSGHGFQLGPATGAVVADLILKGRTTTDIAGFSPRRFEKKK
ncbi:MAG: NAD(P)/FAD-dependent oxidoreductase [Pseudomonadota bacterium]